MAGWQNTGPGTPDPYGPPGQQQPPWGPAHDGYEQPPVDAYGQHQPYHGPVGHDDPIPLPEKRGKGMYIAAGIGGVVVLFMIGAIVMAVMGGGGKTPIAAVPSSTPVSAGTGSGSGAPSPGGGGATVATINLPDSIESYQRWTGPLADAAIAKEKKSLIKDHPTSAGPIKDSQIAIYRKNGILLSVVAQSASNTDVATLLSLLGPAKGADQMLKGGSTPKSFPPGPKGGALHCATRAGVTGTTARCAWADKSTLVLVESHLTQTTLAKLTLSLRNAAES